MLSRSRTPGLPGQLMAGPLTSVRIVEFGGIGAAPFAGMMLADMGADVIRLDRAGDPWAGTWNALNRGRPSICLNLKHSDGAGVVLRLCGGADGLIEGFRPGVMERLGLGPEIVCARNRRLVYGRMTGYGQYGPLSHTAGHDINYIGLAGALGIFARKGERPMFPMNFVGDYGGGGLLLAFGVVSAILEARESGMGQVVDAAMVEGSALMTTLIRAMRHAGMWSDEPGTNALDSGSHFYEVYETADGGHIAIGAIEPKFYAELLRLLDLDANKWPQMDRERWPEFKRRFAEIFRRKSLDEWAALLEGSDACATPVLSLMDAPVHPHNIARGAFTEIQGIVQPAPAPRFTRTRPTVRVPPIDPGAALSVWGFGDDEIAELRAGGVVQ